jgi:uncharacterized protein YjlB
MEITMQVRGVVLSAGAISRDRHTSMPWYFMGGYPPGKILDEQTDWLV